MDTLWAGPAVAFCRFSRTVLEGRNKGGRKATPTNISIFDFYGIKTLWFEFGNDIFTGFKMPRLSSWNALFSAPLCNEIENLYV